MYVNTRAAVRALGLHPNTLRKYADSGLIPFIKTQGGRRLYDVDAYIKKSGERKTICYCRVSSAKQRDDLLRQVDRLKSVYPNAEIVQDIGSGLNFKRKGLRTVLERLLQGEKLELVVSHRDRLVRFGFELVKFMVERNGGAIVVLDSVDSQKSPESELTEDLLAILHHFSCRMHGRRSHKNNKNEKDSDISNYTAKNPVQEMVRSLQIRLQQDVGKDENDARALDGFGEDDIG